MMSGQPCVAGRRPAVALTAGVFLRYQHEGRARLLVEITNSLSSGQCRSVRGTVSIQRINASPVNCFLIN